MKRLVGLLCMTIGAALGALGLLFLIGAGGQLRRVAIGGVLVAVAGVSAFYGSRRLRAARSESPAILTAELLAIARRASGVVTEAQFVAQLGDRASLGLELLSDMVSRGHCRHEVRAGALAFVFPELEPRLVLRRCRFCGYESPLAGAVSGDACPKCGAELALERAATTGGTAVDEYGMDDPNTNT